MALNSFSRMRMGNIMGRSSPTFKRNFINPMEEEDQEQDEASKFYDEMERIRGNSGPGLSAYKKALGEQPTPDQYKPNWLTRIGGALAAGGSGWEGSTEGLQAAMEMRDRPYNRAVEQYGMKLGGLKEQAGMEQDEMNAQLRSLTQARSLGLKYNEFDLKRRESVQKAETDRMTAEASQTRAKAYADNMRKPGYDTFPQEDGSVLYQNKNDKSDNFVIPAKTIAAAQLKVSQTNATSQRMSAGASVSNAATSARNAGINQQRANDYGRNVDSQISDRGEGNLTPSIQKTARDLAISEMQMIPEYAKFARTDEFGDPLDPADLDDEEQENYAEFLMMLDKRVKDILRRKR